MIRTFGGVRLEGFKHMMVSIFFVDEVRNRVELLIKFDPNEKVLLHRHLADTNTFVVEGGACDL